MRKRITILGATGSVGQSALDLIAHAPERFEVVAVTAATNAASLADIARRTGAKLAVVADPSRLEELLSGLSSTDCEAAAGPEALIYAATAESDLVIGAIVGCAGLPPLMAAINAGRNIALANKEALVTAGALMMDAASASKAVILPIDSEHNAIFQCLSGSRAQDVSKIILTASGGPFRTVPADQIARATPAEAVAHPNWAMGAKISVDSATMMNKGLELIEAHFLFGLPSARLDVVVHPQSVVHSMVEFVDGSVLAQLGSPDMRVPIAYALAWPERMETGVERLDLIRCARLDFETPDLGRFPALRLARQALEAGGAAPIVLNAANELAVARFLGGAIRFGDIAALVEEALQSSDYSTPSSIDDVLAVDAEVRTRVEVSMRATWH